MIPLIENSWKASKNLWHNCMRRRRIRVTLKILVALLIFMVGAMFAAYRYFSRDLPSTARLEMIEPSLKTQVIAEDSSIVGEFYKQDRALVPLEEIPDHLINAFLATEDRKFYSHWGVDIFGIARALFANIREGEVVQGASTITQQLARNLINRYEQSMSRKIKEALLAMQIERLYSKDEILELYLNQIYFGSGSHGVEAAARNIFGKNVKDIDIGEAALIAGLPKNPLQYSPFYNPDKALNRRRVVLEAMVDCDMLSKEAADSIADSTPDVLNASEQGEYAAYFMEYVRKYLEAKYGADRLYNDGLQVYTTLDPYLQHVAEDSMESHMLKIEASHTYPQTKATYQAMIDSGDVEPTVPDYLQSAIIAIDVQTGYIRAMVGGRSFKHSKFNRAVQARRQPGSSFKPFVFLSAIDNGYTPADIVLDAPIVLELPHGDVWKPRNFTETFEGEVSLRHALAKSINVASARLVLSIGPLTVINFARKLGVKSPLDNVYSIALGSSDVTLIEMTNAFATLAAGGIRSEPIAVKKVVDRDGAVLEENPVYREEVLSPQNAFMITNMLESALNEGTGQSARLMGFSEPAAGKTGTTNDCTNGWFIGFTTELAVGVWTGFEENRTMGRGMYGGRVSLPTWTDIMKAFYIDHHAEPFPQPDGIVHRIICEESGLLSTEKCTRLRREVFIEGTEPSRTCDRHGLGAMDAITSQESYEDIDEQLWEDDNGRR
jgi:penicillin-binding protein 1A